jgi:hypothetical protein
MSTEKSPYSQLRKPRTRHKKHFFSKKNFQIRTEETGRRKIQKGRNRMKNNKTSSRNSSDSLWLVQQPSTLTYVIARNVSHNKAHITMVHYQQSPHP